MTNTDKLDVFLDTCCRAIRSNYELFKEVKQAVDEARLRRRLSENATRKQLVR